jgi:hypothetical protein
MADIEGWVRFGKGRPKGKFTFTTPRFTAAPNQRLASIIPPIEKDRLSGTFSAWTDLDFSGDSLQSAFWFEITDGLWEERKKQTRIEGIEGVLEFNSLKPAATRGLQKLSARHARKGSFDISDIEIEGAICGGDSIFISSFKGLWAGGRLWSHGIHISSAGKCFDADLNTENLEIQRILDIFKYKGIKAQGTISGHLPMVSCWKDHQRVRFGTGYLEARPQEGRLQLSRENAKAILGLSKDIPSDTKDQEEAVKLMILNALQDMKYTRLRMDFTEAPQDRWETVLSAQGHGPFNDPENRIPIGGLKVNIHALDELLNSMLFSTVDMD